MIYTSLIQEYWKQVEQIRPEALSHALDTSHRAIQLLAAIGQSYVKEREDNSQYSLRWHEFGSLYKGEWLQTDMKFRFGIRGYDLKMFVFNEQENIILEYGLNESLPEEAIIWIKKELANCGLNPEQYIETLPYPFQSPRRGELFELPYPKALKYMCDRRDNANLILKEIAKHFENHTPVWVWPTDFHTTTTIQAETEKKQEELTLGYSFGDATHPEPYFYISPASNTPIETQNGKWVENAYFSGVLLPQQILTQKTPSEQVSCILAFFTEGINTGLKNSAIPPVHFNVK
jgi:hypothetical protein